MASHNNKLTQRSFLKAAALTGSMGLSGCLSAKERVFSKKADQPNILFIIADDLGCNDVGYRGAEIMTPNIDKLAKEGMVFDQHYVMATCSPTRCGLMTGRYPSRFGLLGPTNEQVLPFTQVTLASALKQAGYETYLSGKWHLGSSPEVGPYKYGFDHSYGSLAGGVTAYGYRYKNGPYSKTWHRNGTLIEEEGHVTDLIGQDVVRNIYKAAESSKPFFMYVPFTAPHIPIEEEPKWIDLYKTKIQDPSRRTYAACVTHMDAKIGEFLDALEKTGQRRDTIIIFSSDNGASPGYFVAGRKQNMRYPGIPKTHAMPVLGSNGKLRGMKGQLYEGGIQVPAVVSWPSQLKSGKVQQPVHIVDWMPTLCSVAGCRLTDDLELDGQNIWPWITGQKTQVEERTLYWKTTDQVAIRRGAGNS